MELESHQPSRSAAKFPASEDALDEVRLRRVISSGSLSFDDWTSLISEIENTCPDDVEKLSIVYDSFLSEFPLCHGYWRKYAAHKMRLSNVDKVVDVFEQAVLSATYSVGVWVDYCDFAMSNFEDPDDVRRLFKRAISFVGKDYLCHTLWDKYIGFEFSQQHWSSLAHIYLQILRFPSKKLQHYYDSFKKLVGIWEEEIECQSGSVIESQPEELDNEVQPSYGDNDISDVIKELLNSSAIEARSAALQKYRAIGEKVYKDSCMLDEKINSFESHIHRSYFHIKPLDINQLENWHNYLDFIEKQEDFDWVVKLYERCLIPAANYPEFWMRYVECMENKGGRELANFALDRATRTFLKSMPEIHVYNSRFKEQIGDICGARDSLLHYRTESAKDHMEIAIVKANMEKRWGNIVAASNVYREAIDKAISNKELDLLPDLYIHFAQHLYVTTNSAVAARDALIDAIKHLPSCKLLYEELIKFVMTHGGREHIDVLGAVITTAFSLATGESQVLDIHDLEDISVLFLKFVDLCGTIYDVRKAWNQHARMFPYSLRTKSMSPVTGSKSLKITSKVEDTLQLCKDNSSDTLSKHITREELLSPQICSVTHTEQAKIADESGQAQQVSSKSLERSRESSPEQREPYVDQSPNEAESVQVPQKCSNDDFESADDHVNDHELIQPSVETLSLDPPEGRPTVLVSGMSDEVEDYDVPCISHGTGSLVESGCNNDEDVKVSSPLGSPASGATDSRRKTVSPPSYPERRENHNPAEPRSRWRNSHNWGSYRMDNSERPRRDSRFGSSGNLRRRFQHHARPPVNSSQGYPVQFPSQEHQIQLGNAAANPFQATAQGNVTSLNAWTMQNAQNYNFPYQAPLPAQTGVYSQVAMTQQYPSQSNEPNGDMQSSSQAYGQMLQYYYSYYQQQQLLIQQQVQQLQLTQSQLQQQQQEQHPQYLQVSQQIYQLQQQQQQLYQQQQQLYQQYQQQYQQQLLQQQPYNSEQTLSQEQLFHMQQQQQQQLNHQNPLQQQQPQSEEADQLQGQQNQELILQQEQQQQTLKEAEPTDEREAEELSFPEDSQQEL